MQVTLKDGRSLTVHDSMNGAHAHLTIIWHHGSPQTGAALEPHLRAAAERGIRWVSYGRPSYGGSSDQPGRAIGDAAADVVEIADALGIGRFAVMGASGGGPHALACAALVPERVSGVVTFASLAPFTTEFDWFAGMAGGAHRCALHNAVMMRASYSSKSPSSTATASIHSTMRLWNPGGPHSPRMSESPRSPDLRVSSPMTLPSSNRGVVSRTVFRLQCCSRREATTEWCQHHTPTGCSTTCPTLNCGFAQKTATSRSLTPALSQSIGCASEPSSRTAPRQTRRMTPNRIPVGQCRAVTFLSEPLSGRAGGSIARAGRCARRHHGPGHRHTTSLSRSPRIPRGRAPWPSRDCARQRVRAAAGSVPRPRTR